MKLLYRYILKKCFFNTFLLLFAFAIIYSVVQAIQELGSVGKGDYTTLSMFIYLGALLPSYIYLLIPLSVLIGVMTTLLGLVKNSEYAIMRTSGMSLHHFTRIVTVFGIIFALLTFTLGELIAPQSSHFANTYKLNKTQQQVSNSLISGVWTKDTESRIVNVRGVDKNNPNEIHDIEIFNYNDEQNLIMRIVAPFGKYETADSRWMLTDVTIYNYTESGIKINRMNEYLWSSTIEPKYFKVLIASPDEMPAVSLVKYTDHLKTNKESTNRYEIAMWNKFLYPFACISMAFIAIGFIPNNGRNINLSTKLFSGILIGVAFFFTNKLVAYVATLYEWNPVISALTPTIILFIIGTIVIIKKEA